METTSSPSPAGLPEPRSEEGKLIDSKELFGGDKSVRIRHDNGMYKLAITKQGKLILTK